MTDLQIEQVPVLSDNYVHLVRDPETGACAAVDPAEARPVLDALERLRWDLTHILCTHHHGDHIGGNLEVKRATGAEIVGALADVHRIPGIERELDDGQTFGFGNNTVRALFVPGHTAGHLAYFFEEARVLFSGDCLFSLGCGRLFEGTPAQMWDSLCKLRALPDDTRVFPAHEYTNSNADFALSIDPDNPVLQARADQVLQLRESGRSSLPSTMAEEKAANPFLRADDPALLAAAGLSGLDPVSAFAEIRRRKDVF